MKQKLLIASSVVAIAGVVVGHYTLRTATAHVAAFVDGSDSVIKNCSGLAQFTGRWLEGKPSIQAGSTLSVFIMGRDRHDAEPRPPVQQSIPFDDGPVIGHDPEAYERERQKMFGAVEHACETAKAGPQSPIYRMVKQGLAHLRSLGCGPNGRCYALLKSDLDEDVDPSLRTALERARKDSTVTTPPELVGTLDNAAIEVLVCGVAEVKPRRNASASPETRAAIWKPLFTHPELVTIQPFCGAEQPK